MKRFQKPVQFSDATDESPALVQNGYERAIESRDGRTSKASRQTQLTTHLLLKVVITYDGHHATALARSA